ncbi:MAG: outer membrane lipoprotein-sorting protein [bacterium]|nr:outer membrane lipoprotein-sorting protein [bacterium]
MRTAAAALCILAASAAGARGEEKAPTAEEIVNRANLVAYYAGADGRAQVEMTITDGRGRTRERRMTILRRNVAEGGDQKFYVHFQRPADVRGMAYLVWKHVGRDDDRWLYQPALDLVKRIAAGDKRTSFVGSDFLYEDVSGRGPEEDVHELLRTEGEAYVIRSTPREPRGVEFARYDVWIDRATFMPMRAEYFDRAGKKYRVVEALEVREIGGHPTVVRSKANNLESGGHTVSVFSDVAYGVGLPDDIFTERYLRRAPTKWLK